MRFLKCREVSSIRELWKEELELPEYYCKIRGPLILGHETQEVRAFAQKQVLQEPVCSRTGKASVEALPKERPPSPSGGDSEVSLFTGLPQLWAAYLLLILPVLVL